MMTCSVVFIMENFLGLFFIRLISTGDLVEEERISSSF
jgi:hypothetical protein